MRYDRWDVILFPGDTPIPMQEFKTACYNSRDPNDPTPVLTSYIASLPPSAPFRVSIYSWGASTLFSADIESLRKEGQKLVYMLQVIVDGSKVYHGLFDASCKWPKEIAYEHRILSFPSEESTVSRKTCLRFPPFAPDTVLRPTMDIYEQKCRINIVLSEQLIGSGSRLELGAKIDIVCFSFVHAPREILEQTGISWPIRNPLHLPGIQYGDSSQQAFNKRIPLLTNLGDMYEQQAQHRQRGLKPSVAGLKLPEPIQRPRSQPPSLSIFPRPILSTRQERGAQKRDGNLNNSPTIENSDQFLHPGKGRIPNNVPRASTGEFGMPPISVSLESPPSTLQAIEHKHEMLLSDDPFTSMPDVTDPFSQEHSLNSVPASKYSMPLEQTFPMHAHHPSASTFSWSNASRQRPKSFLPSLSTMAALTRGATFPGRPASTQANSMSTAKRTKLPTRGSEENQTPSQARLPTTFPGTNCGPTLNRFVASHPYLDPELLTKDPSSQDLSHELPSMYGSVEYRSSDKTQHPLRRMSRTMIDFAGSTTRPNALSQRCDVASPVEIIDVDALSPDKTPKPTIPTMPTLSTARLSPFKLCHKPATSSMDSTRRLENALFHALTDGDGQPGADFNVGLGMAGLPMMNAGEDDGDVLLAPVSPGEAKEVGGEGREIGSKRKASDEGGDNGDDDDEDDGEGRSRKRERSADEGSGVGDEGEKREDSLNKD